MIAKKSSRHDLERKRTALFAMGLLAAGSFTLAAFTYNSPLSLEKDKLANAHQDIEYLVDDLSEKDAEKLMSVISNYPFPTKHIEAKEQMIKDLGKLKNPVILPFLTDLYTKMEDTAMYQLAVLKALSLQKNKKASKTFKILHSISITSVVILDIKSPFFSSEKYRSTTNHTS